MSWELPQATSIHVAFQLLEPAWVSYSAAPAAAVQLQKILAPKPCFVELVASPKDSTMLAQPAVNKSGNLVTFDWEHGSKLQRASAIIQTLKSFFRDGLCFHWCFPGWLFSEADGFSKSALPFCWLNK